MKYPTGFKKWVKKKNIDKQYWPLFKECWMEGFVDSMAEVIICTQNYYHKMGGKDETDNKHST